MKKLEAIINPTNVDEVKDDLIDLGVKTITTTEAKGYARAWAHTEIYRGTKYTTNSLIGIKMEVLLDEELMDDAILILSKGLGRRAVDDGDILIVPVDTVPEYLACSRIF